MEILGDAVLQMVITDMLIKNTKILMKENYSHETEPCNKNNLEHIQKSGNRKGCS